MESDTEKRFLHLYKFSVVVAITTIEHSANKVGNDVLFVSLSFDVEEVTVEHKFLIGGGEVRVLFHPRISVIL